MSIKCPFCLKPVNRGAVLVDKEGKAAGVYCSRDCADQDACGPRFRPYSIRRANAADRKSAES